MKIKQEIEIVFMKKHPIPFFFSVFRYGPQVGEATNNAMGAAGLAFQVSCGKSARFLWQVNSYTRGKIRRKHDVRKSWKIGCSYMCVPLRLFRA